MRKKFYFFSKFFVLLLMLCVFVSCEQIESMKLLDISKADINSAILRMKELSDKNSEPCWNIDISTAQYLQFEFKTIEGTEIVKGVYFESSKILVVARKDSILKNVVQLYYVKNVSIDNNFIIFPKNYPSNSFHENKNSYCESFVMVNIKNNVAVYGEIYTYPKTKDLTESINNIGWIKSIIGAEKLQYQTL